MAAKIHGGIFRNYLKVNDINLYKKMNNLHSKIFDNYNNNVSKYGKGAQDLLNDFFSALYKCSTGKENNLYSSACAEIFEADIRNAGVEINSVFNQSGVKFEKALENLLNNFYTSKDGVKVQGTNYAGVYISKTDFDSFLKDIVLTESEEIINDLYKRVLKKGESDKNAVQNYVLIGATRSGKIDMSGNSKAQIKSVAESKPQYEAVMKIIQNATFSIKSYQSTSSIHLGKTVKEKAISSVLTGFNEKEILTFYIAHGDNYVANTEEKGENKAIVKRFNNHFNHIKKMYELSGFGLNYQVENGGATHVDFLIENRTSGGGIKVYSVKHLLNKVKWDEEGFSWNYTSVL